MRTLFRNLANIQKTTAQVVNANVSQPPWVAPSMLNSWVSYGSISYDPKYSKDEMGVVRLRGMIKSGTVTAAAFVLPAGYRPTQTIRFSVASNSLFGMCTVDSSGNVVPQVGSNTSFSLEGVEFFAEA